MYLLRTGNAIDVLRVRKMTTDRKAYPGDLTRAQAELLLPLIPPGKKGGRPRSVELLGVINALFDVMGFYNILRKAFPNAFNRYGIERCVVHPRRINLSK
jgi:hypothetical protein